MAAFGGIFGGGGSRKAQKLLASLLQSINSPFSQSNLTGYRGASVNAGLFGDLTFNREADGSFRIDTGGLFETNDLAEQQYELLRELREPTFNQQFSSLESRLFNQGRLDIGTGSDRANPTLAAFFGAANQQDSADRLGAITNAQNYSLAAANTLLPGLFAARSEADAAQQASVGLRQQLNQLEVQEANQPSAFGQLIKAAGIGAASYFGGPLGGTAAAGFFDSLGGGGGSIAPINLGSAFGGGSSPGGLFGAGSFAGYNTFGTGLANDPLQFGVFT